MILSFEKPKKILSTQEHNDYYSSDTGIDGTYVPNMSREDREKWKAKHIKGEDPRVEIRKTLNGVQLLMVVRPGGVVDLSANGKLKFDNNEFQNFMEAKREAERTLSGR